MNNNNLIAIDLAKEVFQVCGMNLLNKVTFNKQLRRSELILFMNQQSPCEVVMEACYSSHYWAREFQNLGHTVKLLPAQHVSPFVRGNKSDKNDVIGIAEASKRPNIIPVPVKNIEQQDIQSLHRIRERLIGTRTALVNQIRGLLSEHGIIAPKGLASFCSLLAELVATDCDKKIGAYLKNELPYVQEEYELLNKRIKRIDDSFRKLVKDNALCQILSTIPGVGPINATAIYSAIGNGSQFKNGREFAVWLGVTPRQSSSGNSFYSGGITKRGNRYLRKQLVHGARAILTRCKNKTDRVSLWANKLALRVGKQKAYVALAARMARIAWILLHKNENYKVVA